MGPRKRARFVTRPLLEALELHVGRAARVVVQLDPPGAAADLAVLHVFLHAAAAGVEREAHRRTAVGARGFHLGIEQLLPRIALFLRQLVVDQIIVGQGQILERA